jgi:hypothetical protein
MGDLDSYRQQLTDVDWETMFGHDDVDTIVDIIANTILNIADNTITSVKSTLNGLLMRIKSNKDELCSVTYVGSVIS